MAYSFEKCVKNMLRHPLAGESHQVVKISVSYCVSMPSFVAIPFCSWLMCKCLMTTSPYILLLHCFLHALQLLFLSLLYRPVISPLMNHPRKEEDGVGRKSDKAGQDKAMHTTTH